MARRRESIFAWRKAKGDTTGVRSIALKARENLRQTRETRRRSLGICHARFLRNLSQTREKGERTMKFDSIVPISARLYNVKFIREGNKNFARRGNF